MKINIGKTTTMIITTTKKTHEIRLGDKQTEQAKTFQTFGSSYRRKRKYEQEINEKKGKCIQYNENDFSRKRRGAEKDQ